MLTTQNGGSQLVSELVATFFAKLPRAQERWTPEQVGAAVDHAMQVALAAYPTLGLDGHRFIERLAGLLPSSSEWPDDFKAWLGERCVADLYLATACTADHPAALRLFETQLIAKVPSFVSRLNLPSDLIDEAQQILRTKLFVGTAESGPVLDEYQGRGSLVSWVRVTAVRIGLDIVSVHNRHQQEEESVADELLAPDSDVELTYLKTRYRAVFKQALADAIQSLSVEQRNLLRMSVVGGLTTIQLAALFAVNQSTIVRRLQTAKEQLGKSTQKLLRERLHLDQRGIESMFRLVQSQLDASMERLLQDHIE